MSLEYAYQHTAHRHLPLVTVLRAIEEDCLLREAHLIASEGVHFSQAHRALKGHFKEHPLIVGTLLFGQNRA